MLVNLAEGRRPATTSTSAITGSRWPELCTGKRVRGAFCYSGGFGLHAAQGGAQESLVWMHPSPRSNSPAAMRRQTR